MKQTKRNKSNEKITIANAKRKQQHGQDETDFLEYDEPYKDDPFKEHEVIIS